MLTWPRRGRPRQAPPGLEVGCPSPSLCSPADNPRAHSRDQRPRRPHPALPTRPPGRPVPPRSKPGVILQSSHRGPHPGSEKGGTAMDGVSVSCVHTGRLRGYTVLGCLSLWPPTPVLMPLWQGIPGLVLWEVGGTAGGCLEGGSRSSVRTHPAPLQLSRVRGAPRTAGRGQVQAPWRYSPQNTRRKIHMAVEGRPRLQSHFPNRVTLWGCGGAGAAPLQTDPGPPHTHTGLATQQVGESQAERGWAARPR